MTPGIAYSADISLSETSRLAAPYGNCGQPDHDMAEHMVGDMEHRYQKVSKVVVPTAPTGTLMYPLCGRHQS